MFVTTFMINLFCSQGKSFDWGLNSTAIFSASHREARRAAERQLRVAQPFKTEIAERWRTFATPHLAGAFL